MIEDARGMRAISRAKIQKGFTLIEVIAALAIIGLGLVGILSLFPVGIDASKRAGDLTTATALGQSVLDQIRSAAKRGDLALNDAERLFKASPPMDFGDEDQWLGRDIGPIDTDRIPRIGGRTYYEFQVEFEEPEKATESAEDRPPYDGLSEVGLRKVTVTVSWPADEEQIELRNKVTLLTFIRFPR